MPISGNSSRMARAVAETLGRMRRRHPDVNERELGLVLADQREEFGGASGLGYDLKLGTLQQTRDSFSQEDVVVRSVTRSLHVSFRLAGMRRLWLAWAQDGRWQCRQETAWAGS